MKLFLKLSIYTIIPVFIIFLFLYYNLNKQLVDGAQKSILVEKQKDIDKLNLQFNYMVENLTNISKVASISSIMEFNSQEQLNDKISLLMRSVPTLLSINYIAQNGFERIGIEKERPLQISDGKFFFNDDSFQISLLENKVYSQINFEADTLILNISRRVIDINNGEILGVVLLKFSLFEFHNMIVDKLVEYYGIEIEYQGDTIYKSKSMNDLTAKNNQLISIAQKYPNEMGYTFVLKKEKYLNFINQALRENIYLLVVLLLIMFGFIIVVIKNSLRPLEDLTSTIINKINKIDSKSKLDKEGANEIDTLTTSFDIFDSVIHKNTKALKSLNETLEERIDQEVERNRKNELQLLEQSKMVAMGDMIGNIAHQWRQPLSVISASASAMLIEKQCDILDDQRFEKSCNAINDNVQYLSQTIDTFRNFLKEKKEFREVVLQDRISVALNILVTTLKNNHITLKDNIDYENPIKIKLVVGELSQVIMNIINNAKDILLEKRVEDPWVLLELHHVSDKAILTIEDNGGGVPKEIISRIFEPYFSTKHQSQGTGLGLHMSYKIITESLKGKIWVENTANGAKFFIELPLEQESS